MEKNKKKLYGHSVKVDNETYNKLVELNAKTHIPMAAIMRLSVEMFEQKNK